MSNPHVSKVSILNMYIIIIVLLIIVLIYCYCCHFSEWNILGDENDNEEENNHRRNYHSIDEVKEAGA